MNVPNTLTLTRLILIPFFIAAMLLEVFGFALFNNFVALGIFAIASLTDFLDGYIARKYNMITDFGKLFDSAADKLLCCSALILLVLCYAAVPVYNVLIAVFVVVIVCRELFMTAFRSFAANKGIVIAADMPGKIKTVAQMIAIMLLILAIDLANFTNLGFMIVFYAGFGFLALGTLMALLSCVLYLVKYPMVFSEKGKVDDSNDEADINNDIKNDITNDNSDAENYSDIMRCIILNGKVSTSLLQRNFCIGYSKATRILDNLAEKKWIGAPDLQGKREVYMTKEQFTEIFGEPLEK